MYGRGLPTKCTFSPSTKNPRMVVHMEADASDITSPMGSMLNSRMIFYSDFGYGHPVNIGKIDLLYLQTNRY